MWKLFTFSNDLETIEIVIFLLKNLFFFYFLERLTLNYLASLFRQKKKMEVLIKGVCFANSLATRAASTRYRDWKARPALEGYV